MTGIAMDAPADLMLADIPASQSNATEPTEPVLTYGPGAQPISILLEVDANFAQ